jgi:hypothetical protein
VFTLLPADNDNDCGGKGKEVGGVGVGDWGSVEEAGLAGGGQVEVDGAGDEALVGAAVGVDGVEDLIYRLQSFSRTFDVSACKLV